jgi:hypothetical protein
MRDFTNIHTALDNLVAEVAAFTKDIIADANTLRKEYLDVQHRMEENRVDLIEFADLVGHTADCLEVLAGDALDVADLVADVLLEGEAPTCNYEDFVTYCDACGNTIAKGDDYTNDEDSYLCHSCSTVEAIDGEQMELPIDEIPVEVNA